ncbi:MAG: hypothetical protein HY344_03625 [Candidatus Levybacteria bacterium]|nr:hypothetical protein [Candidatus Levybacteria bacterium]
MKLLLIILLFIALILENSITTIPFTIAILVVSTVIFRDYSIFLLFFIFGIFLDILSFSQIGLSSLFFTFLVFLILIYEKKFEIYNRYFIAFATALSSLTFLLLFQRGNVIIQSLVSMLISLVLFEIFKKLTKKQNTND